MAEAVRRFTDGDKLNTTASAARVCGEVAIAPDGQAGVYPDIYASGDLACLETTGQFWVAKTASIYLFAGQEVYWDHSANTCTYWATNDKDFFLGTVTKDAIGTDTIVCVDINRRAKCVYNAGDPGAAGASRTVQTMTTGSGAPAGGVIFTHSGGSHIVKFGTAAEAQAADVLSVRSVPVASKYIWSAVGTVVADGDADVVDVVFGMADASSTSDPDAITTSAFFHLDLTGSNANIYAESDNAAAEVGAQDTTYDWVAGTPFHMLIDARSGDGSGLKYYLNGLRVVSGSAFTVAGATGPLKALFLVEKSSNDSPGSVSLDDMRIWLAEDAAAA
jgi:hypothetical protein